MNECRRLHHRPYFLNIGQAYPHKNLKRLIQAFNAIASRYPEVDLLLLGKSHPVESKRLEQLISQLGLSERVIFKCYVSYADLPHWYRGALALVYPSLWEGFGLPILEAMACGCPVITSLGSGTEEVAGGKAILVDPTRIDGIHHALIEVLTMASMNLSAMSKAGVQYVSQYSWQNTRDMIGNLMLELV
jgi:glycosyltransferase involved in cell wall biosynthesis